MLNRRKNSTNQGQSKIGRVFIALGVFINVYMLLSLFFGEMGLFSAAKVRKAYAKAQTDIHSLQRDNEHLSVRIEALESDPHTIEGLARERLGLVKEGELVYEFIETKPH